MCGVLFGCGEAQESVDATSTSDVTSGEFAGDETTEDGVASGDAPCVFPLVKLQTGQDDTCAGGNEHHWPVGMDEAACHGWRGIDNSGGTHDNSANAIRCNADGTFEFTQFAGNLDCQGSGVTKVYSPGVCEQDIPPMLYTVAIDLTCCSDPDSPDCLVGMPSVGVSGGEISLDGVVCEE